MHRAVVTTRLVAVLLTAATVLGCSAGPSTRPPVALRDAGLAPAGPAPGTTSSRPPALPELDVPTTDLPWADCTAATLTRLGAGPAPEGLVLECATLDVPLDDAVEGTVELGLLRARLPDTPAGVAPLVLVAGADEPSTSRLVRLVLGPGAGLVASRPVVALDRRGTGTSSALACLSAADRAALVDLDAGAPDAVTRALELGRSATVSCTDALFPAELAYDSGHAAADVERLRQALGVDTLAVLGSGDGAALALRDAVRHPGRLSRLVLDSPAEPATGAAVTARAQARGAEVALDSLAAACVVAGCPVEDLRATVGLLVEQARAPGGLAAGDGRRASAGAVLVAVRHALRSPDPLTLPRALAQARDGDAAALLALVDAATGRAAPGGDTTRPDSVFVATCSDAEQLPTADQVVDLAAQWSTESPVFGADAAVRLLLCLAWPSTPDAPRPAGLEGLAPVLVLGAAADPVRGPEEATATATVLRGGGGTAAVLATAGSGHPVLAVSGCAATAVQAYVTDGTLPAPDALCPP